MDVVKYKNDYNRTHYTKITVMVKKEDMEKVEKAKRKYKLSYAQLFLKGIEKLTSEN